MTASVWEDAGMDREFGAPESLGHLRRLIFAPPTAAFDAAFRRRDDDSADSARPDDASAGAPQLSR
jgi:hypothetical protein